MEASPIVFSILLSETEARGPLSLIVTFTESKIRRWERSIFKINIDLFCVRTRFSIIRLKSRKKQPFSFFSQAAISQTPLEIFQFMATNGLCVAVPDWYVAWAWELEQLGNYKKAEAVFVRALENVVENEEDRRRLDREHRLFQVGLGRNLGG